MRDLIRVLIVGAGQMGRAIARLLLDKDGLQVVGICDRRQDLAGADIGELCGGPAAGVPVESDLDRLLERARPDVAIQATCSRLNDAWPDIERLLTGGVNVISIAEEMAFPRCRSAALAEEMDLLARANGVVVLGTGINPGFVLDLLIIALSGVCARVDFIEASRTNDLSPYGGTVLRAQGVGLTPEAFARGLRDGNVVGHVGFPESMHMIASALGWSLDRIEETREPVVASERRESAAGVIEAGQVAGCRHRARAYRGDDVVISFDHPQVVAPQLEGLRTEDRIEIVGAPGVQLAGRPEIAGGEATAALAVNVIPRVLSARPGLKTMAQLPVAAALHGDVRRFVHRREVADRG